MPSIDNAAVSDFPVSLFVKPVFFLVAFFSVVALLSLM